MYVNNFFINHNYVRGNYCVWYFSIKILSSLCWTSVVFPLLLFLLIFIVSVTWWREKQVYSSSYFDSLLKVWVICREEKVLRFTNSQLITYFVSVIVLPATLVLLFIYFLLSDVFISLKHKTKIPIPNSNFSIVILHPHLTPSHKTQPLPHPKNTLRSGSQIK